VDFTGSNAVLHHRYHNHRFIARFLSSTTILSITHELISIILYYIESIVNRQNDANGLVDRRETSSLLMSTCPVKWDIVTFNVIQEHKLQKIQIKTTNWHETTIKLPIELNTGYRNILRKRKKKEGREGNRRLGRNNINRDKTQV